MMISHSRKQPASNTEEHHTHTDSGAAARANSFDNPAYESTTSFLSLGAPPPRIVVTDSVLSPERKSVITNTKGGIRV